VTIPDLVRRLDPLAAEALATDDPDLRKVAIVLCAVLGCIDDRDGTPIDRATLDVLAIQAGLICEHRLGRHA